MTDKIKKPKQKLELTWIGKDVRPRLEPRILLPDDEHSHPADNRSPDEGFDNKLIYGDNLLVLKSLEQDYSGKVKCVFIDPPYNTGSAFEHYEDGVEHSIWLRMMRDRLELLRTLLAEDGSLWMQLDDNEFHYAKVLCDEIFGRQNFITSICVKMSHLSGVKMSHLDKKPPKLKEFILLYCKNKEKYKLNPIYEPTSWNDSLERYTQYIDNFELGIEKWSTKPVKFMALEKGIEIKNPEQFEKFLIKNSKRIIRTARNKSLPKTGIKGVFTRITTKTGLEKIVYNDEEVLFASDKMRMIEGELKPCNPVGDIWLDIGINNLHNEGGVDFKNGKKPEKLLKRCIEMTTNEGDLVLDSFAGSGTTGAVAHKMKRKWIMVELGKHCHTHIFPRMKQVVDGTDDGGISKSVGWKSGGGFRAYTLAPSMLKKDGWGYRVIDMDFYDADMLAEAMCKHMGFKYAPDGDYWMHGRGQENTYIYVTPQTMVAEQLHALNEAVGEGRSLLVCCSAYRGKKSDYHNLTIKRIPEAVLKNCERWSDSYSLGINGLPITEADLRTDSFNEEEENNE